MISQKFKVVDEAGLHARPASIVVKTASEFKSDINIEHNEKKVNLKSIMMVLSLGVQKDAEIIIHADGEDEKEAIEAILITGKKEKLFE